MKRFFELYVILSVVIVGLFTYGLYSYLTESTSEKTILKSNISQTFKMTYPDGTTVRFAVQKPLSNTEHIELVYLGSGEAPKNFEAYVNFDQVLLDAITTQSDVRSLLNYLHLRMNEIGIEDNSGTLNVTWDVLGKRRMNSMLYYRLAEVVDNPKVSKDFQNLAALTEIAHEKQDPQAIVYMHQIIHDLDKYVYENIQPGENVSHFGVTFAENGPNIAEIEYYIIQNKKSASPS